MINLPYHIAQTHHGEFWFHLHKPCAECSNFCNPITAETWRESIEKISGIKTKVFDDKEKTFTKEKQ